MSRVDTRCKMVEVGEQECLVLQGAKLVVVDQEDLQGCDLVEPIG